MITDAEFIANIRRHGDPSLEDLRHLVKLIQDGDVVHVDETSGQSRAALRAVSPLLRDLDAIARRLESEK